MANPDKSLADQLLAAQTQYFLNLIEPDQLVPLLERELDFIYEKLSQVTLNTIANPDKVKATAHRYAIEMEIGGGIPELFGEIADIIYEHQENDETLIGDIIPDTIAQEFVSKVFEHGSVLDRAIAKLQNSDPFKRLVTELVIDVLKSVLFERNQLMKIKPLANGVSFMRDWINQRTPDLSDGLENYSKDMIDSTIARTLGMVDTTLAQEQFRENTLFNIMALWDEVQSQPVSQFRDHISKMDLQEFMVLGYEFWLQFRHTEYLQSSIDAGVKFFFDKYGEETLATLLEELGVTKEMVISELINYAPDLGQVIKQQGIAEAIIKRQLEGFYASQEAKSLLEAN